MDRVSETLTEIQVLQAAHNASLSEHMRRTEALEELVTLTRTELSPLKTHVAVWGVLAKILTAMAAVAGIVAAASKILAG